MNDIITTKSVSIATLDAANYPGSEQSYPRVTGNAKVQGDVRRSLHRGSLNPVEIRISHQPATVKSPQRSLIAVTASRARVDALSNVLAKDVSVVKFQFEKGDNVTLAEFKEDVELLLGVLTTSSGAALDQLFNLES